LVRVYVAASSRARSQHFLDAAEWTYEQLTREIFRGALPAPISVPWIRNRFYTRLPSYFKTRIAKQVKALDNTSALLQHAEAISPIGIEVLELKAEVLRAWAAETAPLVVAHDLDLRPMSDIGEDIGWNRFRVSDELHEQRLYMSRKGQHLVDFAEEYLVARGCSYSVREAVIFSLMVQTGVYWR
jgi:hypothetical protein